ncbi:hypothetical protein FIBSPDRAFT_865709 [Athelia psychrophila]|uniref:PQ loop repeat protein n=1 Tax=Athelia psychrophila TaxID=1759441 RepID=A0A166FF27_9AGAM|nr:hypothetical protein FIBSPDRAFT_865709 [Fibularhizoctonia sp. CBS 109695]
MTSSTCTPHHDWFTATLTGALCLGLVISYLPQHLRIFNKKSSEGFSPWFLLLGSTSSAAGMLNMITMQWSIVKCCRVFSTGDCVESVAGVFQLFLQWFMFTIILVLYMVYYPPHLKYAAVDIDEHNGTAPRHIKTAIRSDDWRLSVTLAAVVAVHLLLLVFVTFLLLGTTPPQSDAPLTPLVSIWATFLGVSSAILAAIQYMPQIYHTYNAKLVGALSIPMMCMQSPGAIAMVLSIALRPGTNWTSWATFAVSGTMQATLLVMCFAWKYRQNKLGLDDFGHPVHDGDERSFEGDEAEADVLTDDTAVAAPSEESPLLQKGSGGRRA